MYRTVHVSALNIRAHPHEFDIYYSLIKDLMRLRRPIKIRGNDYLLLSSLGRPEEDGMVYGTIARYTEIDPTLPWFSQDDFDAAQDDQIAEIVIPKGLKPNFRSIFFGFSPQHHIIIVETYGFKARLSAGNALTYFKALIEDPKIQSKYKKLVIDIFPSKEILNKLLKSNKIRELRLVIRPPNPPDDNGDLERFFEKSLPSQNIRETELIFRREDGLFISPSNEMQRLAKIAGENGNVTARIQTNSGVVTESTKDHPATEMLRYDPDLMGDNSAFKAAANSMLKKLRSEQ